MRPSSNGRQFAGALVLLGACLLAGGCGRSEKSEQAAEVPPPSGPEPGSRKPGEADYKFTTAEMEKECADGKAAAAKFTGKVIELSGTVGAVEKGSDGQSGVILLRSTSPMGGISGTCVIDDPNPIGKYAKGQSIRVKGTVMGLVGSPVLKPCEVVEKGPDTAVRIKSDTLASDYTADRAQTEKKCKDKTLVVTGAISAFKTDTDGGNIEYLELKGDGSTTIEIRYDFGVRSLKDQYKVGDTVTLVGEMFEFRNQKSLFVMIGGLPAAEQKK